MASLFQPSPEERLAKIERQKQLQQQWPERDRLRSEQNGMPNPQPNNQNMYTPQQPYSQPMQPSFVQQPEQSFNSYNYTPQPAIQAPPVAGGVVRGVALDELRGISLDDRERKRQEQLKFRMDIERQIQEKQERKAKEKRDLEEQIRKEDLANQGYNGFYPPTSNQPQAIPQAMPQVNSMGYYSPSPIPSNFPPFQQSQQQNMNYNNGSNVVHPTNVPGLMVNQQGPLCVSPFPQYNQQPQPQPLQQYNNNNNNNQMMMMMNQQPPSLLQQQQLYQQPQFSPSHQQQLQLQQLPPQQQQMFNMNQQQQISPQQMMMNNNNTIQQNQQQYNNNNNNNSEDLPPIPQTGESISNLLKRVYKPKSLDDDEDGEEEEKPPDNKVSNNKQQKPKRSKSIKKKPIHIDEDDSDEQREDKPKKQKKKIVDAYKKDKEREKYNNNVAQRMKAIEDKKREELQRKAEEREKRIKEKSKELNPVKLPVKRASIHATKVTQQTPVSNNNKVKPSSRENNKFDNNKPKRHISIKREVQILQEEEEEEEEDNNNNNNSNDEYQYEEDKRVIKPKQSPRININNNNNNNIKPSLIPKPSSVMKRKSSKNNNNKVSYISPIKDSDRIIDPEEIPILHKQSSPNNNNSNISPIQSIPNNYDIKRSKSPITSPTKSKSPIKSSYNELAEMCHKLEEEQEILKSELHQQFEIVKSLKSQTPRKPTATNDIENEFVTPRGYNNNNNNNSNNNKLHINPSQSSSPNRQFSKIMTPSKISNVFTPKKDVLKQSIKQAGKSILDPLTPGQKMGRISSANYSSSSQSPTDFEPSRSKSSNMIGLKLDNNNICDDIILTGDSRFYDVDAPFDVSEVSCELMGNNKLIYDYYNSMEDVGKNQIALNVPPPPSKQTKLSTIKSTEEDDYDDDGKNNEFSDSFDDDDDELNNNKEHDALDEFISTSKKGMK